MPRLSDIARMSRQRRQKDEKSVSSSAKKRKVSADVESADKKAMCKVNLEDEEEGWLEIPDSPNFDLNESAEACEEEAPSSTSVLEETRVSKRTFVCFSCAATVNGSLLNQHVYQHHLNRPLFACPVVHCGFSSIYSKYTVDIHISRIHPELDRTKSKPICRKHEFLDEIQACIKRCFGLNDTADEADVRSLMFELVGKVCSDPDIADMDRLAQATQRRRSTKKKATLTSTNDDADDDKLTTKCELCGERVENRTVHARSHSSLPIFQCGYCDYSTFDYGRRVRKHIASKHPGWPVQVVDRSQEFARQLQAIKTTCFPLLFGGAQTVTPSGHERCQVCLKDVRSTYRTNHVLLYHLKLDMFKCSVCAYSSQHLKAAVKQHIERKHRGQHAHVISSIDSCREVFDDMKEQCFPSLGTGKKRGRPMASLCDSPTVDPVQETRVKRKYVRRNAVEQQPSPQPHQTCRLCGQPGIATKSEHVRVVHMSDTPFFMCPHCDFTRNDFASKLQVHIDKVHNSDAAPIDCSESHQDQIRKLLFQCFPDTRRGRRPLRVGAQQRPLALRPSKSKTDHFTPDGRLALGFVRCRVCDVTLRKTYRMPHMLINHLGREDAYKCSECDFAGNYKRTIEKHAVGVHGPTAFALVNVSVGELDEMRMRCFGRPKSTNRPATDATIEKPFNEVSPEQKILPERRTIRLTFANVLPEHDEQQHSAATNTTDETERKSKRKQSKPRPARFRHVSRNESIESDSKEEKCTEMNTSSTSEEAKECALCAKRVGRANRLTHVLATHLKVKCMFECTRCSYMHDSSPFVVINHMRHKHDISDEQPISHTHDFQSQIADWTWRCFTD